MKRIFFILGCTAVGKSAVGIEVARRIGAEIVSVDSMMVYRRMDIGTAKPSREVRAEIPHHCIDIVEPSESFSVARYLTFADEAIDKISSAGKPVLLVGGSALYIKAVSEGLFEGPGANPDIRQALKARAAAEGLSALHAELTRVDPDAARRISPRDEKRIIRALEVYELTGEPISRLQQQWDSQRLRYDCVFIGLRRPKEEINRRINARVKEMIRKGLRDEVAALLAEPKGLSDQASQALGYAEMIEHLKGKYTLEQAIERIKINTRQFAKRQRTWFRHFRNVQWIDIQEDDTIEKVSEKVLKIISQKL